MGKVVMLNVHTSINYDSAIGWIFLVWRPKVAFLNINVTDNSEICL